jgi:hypothetical protein
MQAIAAARFSSATSLRKNQIGKQRFSLSLNSFQTCEKKYPDDHKKLFEV